MKKLLCLISGHKTRTRYKIVGRYILRIGIECFRCPWTIDFYKKGMDPTVTEVIPWRK